MKYILIILIALLAYVGVKDRYEDKYQAGYQAGMKEALKTNPPSEELEMTCAGLWVGEQNKRYWQKNALR